MDQPARRFTINFSAGSLIGLGVLAIILGGGVLMLFKWLQVSNENSRRRRCELNLATLGRAVHMFHDEHGALPPAVLGHDGPTWAFFLWPYREAGPPKTKETKTTRDDEVSPEEAEAAQRRRAYLATVDRFDFRQTCLAPANADVLSG